jgi:ribose/xylose/arabinose/galactoside ABC-type transport system permease subunit
MNLQRAASRVLSTNGVPIVIALVIVVIIFQIMSPVFLSPGSVRDYLTNAIPVLLLTVGVAIVIVGGGIDLSVGTVAGLSAGTTMWTLVNGAPTWMAVLAGVGTGLVFGLFNGLMITRFGINDFIVTLATLNIAGGLLIVLTEQVPLQGVSTPGFSELVYGRVLGIPSAFWIAAALFILMQFFLIKTVFGPPNLRHWHRGLRRQCRRRERRPRAPGDLRSLRGTCRCGGSPSCLPPWVRPGLPRPRL